MSSLAKINFSTLVNKKAIAKKTLNAICVAVGHNQQLADTTVLHNIPLKIDYYATALNNGKIEVVAGKDYFSLEGF